MTDMVLKIKTFRLR